MLPRSRTRSRSPSRGGGNTVSFSPPTAETPPSSVESPTASEPIIQCFCSAIRNITEICTCIGKCIGILSSNNLKHPVWVPRAPSTLARAVSLAELLSQSSPAPLPLHRLKLAVRLASSVLQFHTSGWLQDRWSNKDVYLVQRGSSQSSLEIPVVHHAFTREPPSSEASIELTIYHCNLSLFSLGIVLIELWFWKRVESPQAHNPNLARFITAAELIRTLSEDAGALYASSVKHCIYGLGPQELRLENNEFKNEVYLKVLQPLEKHLEAFCNKSLGEIFPAPSLSLPSSTQACHWCRVSRSSEGG